eukprot:657693-Hanusia_phi.AAC.6
MAAGLRQSRGPFAELGLSIAQRLSQALVAETVRVIYCGTSPIAPELPALDLIINFKLLSTRPAHNKTRIVLRRVRSDHAAAAPSDGLSPSRSGTVTQRLVEAGPSHRLQAPTQCGRGQGRRRGSESVTLRQYMNHHGMESSDPTQSSDLLFRSCRNLICRGGASGSSERGGGNDGREKSCVGWKSSGRGGRCWRRLLKQARDHQL